MKKLPKADSKRRIKTAGSYGWDLGQVCFTDITTISGARTERLKKAAEEGKRRYKKKTGDQTAMNRKLGPV